jgi:hypothetical protein
MELLPDQHESLEAQIADAEQRLAQLKMLKQRQDFEYLQVSKPAQDFPPKVPKLESKDFHLLTKSFKIERSPNEHAREWMQRHKYQRNIAERFQDQYHTISHPIYKLQEPSDPADFKAHFRFKPPEQNDGIGETALYIRYYANECRSMDAILAFIDTIFPLQRAKNQYPFKMQFSFGLITETRNTNDAGKVYYTYEQTTPNFTDSALEEHHPIVINGKETESLFKDYFVNFVQDLTQNVIDRDTRTRFLAIHSIGFQAYKLFSTQAGNAWEFCPPNLRTMLRSYAVWNYTNMTKKCWWVAYALFDNFRQTEHYDDEGNLHLKGQRIPQQEKIMKHAHSLMCDFYDLPKGNNNHQRNHFLDTYQGFVVATEWRDFCNKFHVNVQEYRWIEEESRATPLGSCYHINKKYPTFNVLQIVLKNGIPHSAFIVDLKRLTGLCFCPKCKQIICKNATRKGNKTFKNHIANCDGTWHKRLKLSWVERPYCPHLFEKKADHPTLSYITFDFETVREILLSDDDKDSQQQKTFIGAKLHPLSVACCLHLDGDT